MGADGNRSLAKGERTEIQTEADARLAAQVVESVVLRGDISALTPKQKADYYVQRCRQLGLDPASKPFAVLRREASPVPDATDAEAFARRLGVSPRVIRRDLRDLRETGWGEAANDGADESKRGAA
jgi:hypothetical protein